MTVSPADGPVFGAVYGTDAMRAAMGERAFLQRMLDTEAALARAQARLGMIPGEAAAAITAAARVETLDIPALAAATRNTGFPVVGLVKQLSAAAGADAGRWTHWGTTTQDIVDTALVLQMRDAFALIAADLDRLIAAFATLARDHRHTVMAGRTHAQQALPITFGYKAALWLDPVVSMRERLAQALPRILKLQFGGAVGTLASLGDRGRDCAAELAKELDLTLPAIPWHVARDGTAEAACWLGMLCGVLAKPATDVMLLMQSEVSEASEPSAPGRGGSSTMPQKRNPIACEYVIAQARAAQALVPQVLGAMAHDHERGAGPMQIEQLALAPIFLYAHGAMAQALLIAEGLVVDGARMRRNLDASGGLIVAEAVMMGLAPLLGRGVAHDVVHHACDVALAEGVTLDVALARDPRVTAHLDQAGIDRLTDPAGYLGATQGFIDAVLARA
ncbi:class-II fumarase/aspartase family protein [Falsiroseomonas stagni]|uniref:3-carboxy-cis,cis-muconate cycloisomerase n=1 Tax=Falsiroseomonas stagni DSM 19981 TaxID=1123062 RepID=A0A1I3Z0F7_9PROT|nr:adenylosuccinate lyase family protein [Falsiroseomonas stagni]SFK37530.1 3-carboxy-cis,cis-muconate cycloisomerase [Falsiroseomonas stagni DSM 19981]